MVEISSEPESPSTSEQSESVPEETGGVQTLVAYFSATNTTKGVAQTITASVGADLYKITPIQPYTATGLDYNDDNSRSTIGMNDPGALSEIPGSVTDVSQDDIVFLGYPIWWASIPMPAAFYAGWSKTWAAFRMA